MKQFKIIILIVITFILSINVEAKEGLVTENGKTYYYENDIMKTGFITINNKLYFFSRVNGALKSGWQIAEEGRWYQDETGEVVTGLQTIDGNKYLFNEKGIMQMGFFTLEDGKTYFFSRANGILKRGWQVASEGRWYQDQSGEVVTGLQTIDGKKYYFNEKGIMKTGFITLDNKLYFFSRVNGALKSGWQIAEEGRWYQDETGEVVTGLQTIDDNKYLFNEKGIMQMGFFTLEDGKTYFFSRANGILKRGWQIAEEGRWYQDETGEVVTGLQTIDDKKYFFNEKGIMKTGFITLNNKLYFFSRVNGALKSGWQIAEEGRWYQDETGEVVTGLQTIDDNKYLFNEKGIMQMGFFTLEDGKTYFFSRANGILKRGWQIAEEGRWYQREDGSLITDNGVIKIENKEYYFENNFVKKGIIEIDGKKYYFDEETYEKKYATTITKYREYYVNKDSGELEKVQYVPTYFMQKDSRWNNKRYGISTFGKTGCAPSSMAMAFTSIKQKEILPTDIATYLYNNTDQFNKRLSGTSGKGIIYASNYYGIKYKGISTKEDLINELKDGKIVFAAMGNGKFATPRWNHAIILFRYNDNNNMTFSYDPLNKLNNSYVTIDTIWNEKSKDPDDLSGGSALYSLYS